MYPFIEQYDESKDVALVQEACKGSKQALEKLVGLHQRFIYNVALKMLRDPDDAADLTQEVLIKMITKLSLFNGTSSFRTWLYRMVMNHFISGKRKRAEKEVISFDKLGIDLDEVHDNEDMSMEEQEQYQDEIIGVRNNCMSGMLLCLDRMQRIVFILGSIFNIKSSIAADILGITPANFRKQLSRAKADLFQFMDHKCGLVNPKNPCRCYKKTKGFMKEGKIDAIPGTFKNNFYQSILSVTLDKNKELDKLMAGKYLHFFTSQVYVDTNVGDLLIKKLLLDPQIRQLFHLN
jgi:RNA polymerase sigma factor (sigma-70 family)